MTGTARRSGMAMAEVVLAIVVLLLGALVLFRLGCVACNLFYHMAATLIGWPLL